MSARVTQNPLQMPDIRLHAIPTSHNYRSGFLLLGGVHIRHVMAEVTHTLPIPMHGLPVSEFHPNDTHQAYRFVE